MKDPRIVSAEFHLKYWGQYVRTHRTHYLGYPRRVPFINGDGVIRATVDTEDTPKEVQVIDSIVRQVGDKVYKAIEARFVDRLTDHEGSKVCGCHKRTYQGLVGQGISFVAGALCVA